MKTLSGCFNVIVHYQRARKKNSGEWKTLEQKDLSRKQRKPVRETYGESEREQWTYQIPRFSSTHLFMWDNKLHIHPYNNHLFFFQKAKADQWGKQT